MSHMSTFPFPYFASPPPLNDQSGTPDPAIRCSRNRSLVVAETTKKQRETVSTVKICE